MQNEIKIQNKNVKKLMLNKGKTKTKQNKWRGAIKVVMRINIGNKNGMKMKEADMLKCEREKTYAPPFWRNKQKIIKWN